MLRGVRVFLRPVREADWALFETWGHDRQALWGPFQRYQLDHLPRLRQAYQQNGLLSRQSGLLMIETLAEGRPIGFVRYSLIPFPDAEFPHPEVGFGLPEVNARGQGFAHEALSLLLDYLFCGYATERVSAFTDLANRPARRTLERLGFRQEGILRSAYFRDGDWQDMALYGLLRGEWAA